MPPDPADLVNTILAATPLHPTRRDMITGWKPDPIDDLYWPQYGDPRPVAARQAAAALRWLADHLLDTYRGTCGCGCDCSADLRELADQLDTQETPAATDNENHVQ